MYGFGQIIYDKDGKGPVIIDDVWDISQYPKRHTHLVAKNGNVWTGPFTFEDQQSREEWLGIANLMLARGDLKPAETPKTHCPDCGNWLTNKPKDWCADAKHADTYAALPAKRCAQ
jgi:hypothetical protein